MNFYDFNGMGDNANRTQSSCNSNNSAFSQSTDGRGEESFEDKFARYSQKSEEELTAQLLDVARRMKAQGSFDSAYLENLYNTAYPMLNDVQRQRMRSIIDMLKG